MHLELPLCQQLLRQAPKHLGEFKVLLFGRNFFRSEREILARRRVRHRVTVLDVLPRQLDGQQGRVGAAAGRRQGLGADLGRGLERDGVKGVFEVVVAVLADLLRAVGGIVVEGGRCAERCDEVEVAGRAGRQDREAGANSNPTSSAPVSRQDGR